MSRTDALARATAHFDNGDFLAALQRRVALPTESPEPSRAPELRAYLEHELAPAFSALGYHTRLRPNPTGEGGPFLIAQRIEDPALPTVLGYGHGDVVRGYDAQWAEGLSPWQVTVRGDKLYGRGTADNKGQHSIHLAALAAVLAARGGRLGFNSTYLIEMGEEAGSPGLHAIAQAEREALAADVFIASDGPRLAAHRPTLFLGSRGVINFKLSLRLRGSGHHSGNWGGLLANPAIVLSHALASLVNAHGVIQVPGLRPPPIPASVRAAIADLPVGGGPDDPAIDPHWGEPGLSPTERVLGWNNLEILAFKAGNPEHPVNAIPPAATAWCQLRFVVGTDWTHLAEHVRAHLDAQGFGAVQVEVEAGSPATRLDPDTPWVRWAVDSMTRSTGQAPVILPNLGGTLPNDVFADILGLPTLWVPHSYPACAQHAPNEHLLAPVVREGLQLMAGLFWDLGEAETRPVVRR